MTKISTTQTQDMHSALTQAIRSEPSLIGGHEKSLKGDAGDGSTVVVSAEEIQLMGIAQPWDWKPDPVGQITMEKFQFCDLEPAKDSGKYFSPGGQSFSSGYRDFLALLSPDFQPQSILSAVKTTNQPPTSGASKSGWLNVLNNAGQLEQKPSYSTSESPEGWIAQVSTQNTEHKLTLEFESGDVSVATSSKEVSVPPDQVYKIQITATAWQRIQIFPGTWYNQAIITIAKARESQYLAGGMAQVAFGPGGLINSRVSEFVVAMMPSAVVTMDEQFASSQQIQASDIQQVKVGGFHFSKGSPESAAKLQPQSVFQSASAGSGKTTISASETHATHPYILAVIIQKFG
ncbi:hypothetical protein [Pontibacter sp. G13]|uniref:hypothetical protein n=1 Tax=Pontibacter sp. G13 TaxID=3074898 RepID=UPI002889AB88|nr:hypothetical protein [Pontibacter sp. G13]WNJ20566.1 hypothetical protein RJD25_08790 [Pontibacter sp. G13]